jgi:hypothetical protein
MLGNPLRNTHVVVALNRLEFCCRNFLNPLFISS